MSAKGPYASGRKDQMTPEWKNLLRLKLDEERMSLTTLEKRVGAASGALSRILGPDQNTSLYVAKICKALDLPMPGSESAEEEMFLSLFRASSPEVRRALMQLAMAAAGGIGPKDAKR